MKNENFMVRCPLSISPPSRYLSLRARVSELPPPFLHNPYSPRALSFPCTCPIPSLVEHAPPPRADRSVSLVYHHHPDYHYHQPPTVITVAIVAITVTSTYEATGHMQRADNSSFDGPGSGLV
ncbi:hypothetical protein DAEQUDRAFT_725672 [Daedalea quercina L-15889]|uniref:Uncharacterized protein n=1 Tax=Daedalea quercina L-15889 TaxID=1314783 RepID=A0A165R6V7_9APHY|nr:hypothetical protein DAEQUDRAFT_725672 [Daedalea quercina L-15889]